MGLSLGKSLTTMRRRVADYQAKAGEREQRALSKAKTKGERQRIKLEMQRDRARVRKEVADAETASLRARRSVKAARAELREVPGALSSLLTISARTGRQVRKARGAWGGTGKGTTTRRVPATRKPAARKR